MRELTPLIGKDARTSPFAKNKKLIPFARQLLMDYESKGTAAFERTLPFDEQALVETNSDYIRLSLALERLSLVTGKSEGVDEAKMAAAIPGEPSFAFE